MRPISRESAAPSPRTPAMPHIRSGLRDAGPAHVRASDPQFQQSVKAEQLAPDQARPHAHRISRLSDSEKDRENENSLGSEEGRERALCPTGRPPKCEPERHQGGENSDARER